MTQFKKGLLTGLLISVFLLIALVLLAAKIGNDVEDKFKDIEMGEITVESSE